MPVTMIIKIVRNVIVVTLVWRSNDEELSSSFITIHYNVSSLVCNIHGNNNSELVCEERVYWLKRTVKDW